MSAIDLNLIYMADNPYPKILRLLVQVMPAIMFQRI